MNKEIAVIFKKIDLDDNLFIFIPKQIVEGYEENNIFKTEDDYAFINTENATYDKINDTFDYYHNVTNKTDLLNHYECDESELKLCKEVYLEELKDLIHIGIYNKETNKTNIYTIHKKKLGAIFKNPIYQNNNGSVTINLSEENLAYLTSTNSIKEVKDYLTELKKNLKKFSVFSTNNEISEVEVNNEGKASKIVLNMSEAKNVNTKATPKNNNYRIDIDVEELEAYVKERIIGQDDNLRGIINTISMNYKTSNPKEIKKALIIGPTGCGKTEVFRVISEYLKVPYTNYSAPDLTAAGYVGNDINDLLKNIIENANKDIKKAENSIVFIDEADKISLKGNTSDNAVNPQSSLLKFLEGHTYDVQMRLGQTNKFDTSLLSIFCGGAFENLELASEKQGIGFNHKILIPDKRIITNEDLIKYGMKKELIGRLPVQYIFNQLSEEDLKQLLLTSKISPLLIEKNRIKRDLNVDLEYDDSYIEAIINKAIELNTGARSLKGSVDRSLEDAEFELQKKSNMNKYNKLLVTGETVTNNKVYTLKK